MYPDGYCQLPACTTIKWNGDTAKLCEVSGETTGALKEEKRRKDFRTVRNVEAFRRGLDEV